MSFISFFFYYYLNEKSKRKDIQRDWKRIWSRQNKKGFAHGIQRDVCRLDWVPTGPRLYWLANTTLNNNTISDAKLLCLATINIWTTMCGWVTSSHVIFLNTLYTFTHGQSSCVANKFVSEKGGVVMVTLSPPLDNVTKPQFFLNQRGNIRSKYGWEILREKQYFCTTSTLTSGAHGRLTMAKEKKKFLAHTHIVYARMEEHLARGCHYSCWLSHSRPNWTQKRRANILHRAHRPFAHVLDFLCGCLFPNIFIMRTGNKNLLSLSSPTVLGSALAKATGPCLRPFFFKSTTHTGLISNLSHQRKVPR